MSTLKLHLNDHVSICSAKPVSLVKTVRIGDYTSAGLRRVAKKNRLEMQMFFSMKKLMTLASKNIFNDSAMSFT